MEIVREWNIRNIKFRIYIDSYQFDTIKQKCLCNQTRKKKHSNFCVYKNIYNYTIFESGCINITGVKDYSLIESAIDVICDYLKVEKSKDLLIQDNEKYIIDNILYTGSFQIQLPIKQLNSYIYSLNKKKLTDLKGQKNGLHFPGLFVKVGSRRGRIILFSSGKFVILGVQCLSQFYIILQEMAVFIKRFMRTNERGVLYALNAD